MFGITAFLDRFAAIPGLLITSIICFGLLRLHTTQYRSSEDLRDRLDSNKPLIAASVQVVSHILGVIYVQILCSLLRTSFMCAISRKPFALYKAQFVQAASTPRLTWVLPKGPAFFVVIWFTASLVPAALWSAAITPLPSEREISRTLNIPTFNVSNTSTLWKGDMSTRMAGVGQRAEWTSNEGLFSFSYNVIKPLLQASGRDASVLTNGQHVHAKLDKTGFTYVGRSYGTGGIAGFFGSQFHGVKAPNQFTYSENGLQATVSCFYNSSMDYRFEPDGGSAYIPQYRTTGILANGTDSANITDTIPVYTAWSVVDLFGWSVCYSRGTQKLQFQIITGMGDFDIDPSSDSYSFGQFKNVQCDVTFASKPFEVTVNNTDKSIISKALDNATQPWPAYGDAVAEQIRRVFMGSTFGDGCSGGCSLGRDLVTNINQLKNSTKGTNEESNTDPTLKGTEDYLTSMIDDLLVNQLQTRIVSKAPQPTEEVTAEVGVPAIVFGGRRAIIAVCVVNLLIILAYLEELVRTRAWTNITSLDLMDISEVIQAAFQGGHWSARSLSHSVQSEWPTDSEEAIPTLSEKSVVTIFESNFSHASRSDSKAMSPVPMLVPYSMSESCDVWSDPLKSRSPTTSKRHFVSRKQQDMDSENDSTIELVSR